MYRVQHEQLAFVFTLVLLLGLGFFLSWINIYLLIVILLGVLIHIKLTQAKLKETQYSARRAIWEYL